MFKYRSFTHIRNNVLEHYIEGYVLPFTLKLNLSQSLYPLFRHIFDTFLLKKKKRRNNIDFMLTARLSFFLFQVSNPFKEISPISFLRFDEISFIENI